MSTGSGTAGSGGWWSTADASGRALLVKRNLNPTLVNWRASILLVLDWRTSLRRFKADLNCLQFVGRAELLVKGEVLDRTGAE